MTKKILITGATGGIGKQTAIKLATMGYEIIITGRYESKCREVVDYIIKKSKNKNVNYICVDLTDISGVYSLFEKYKEQFHTMDILINNLGLVTPNRMTNGNNIEMTFHINVVVPYLLTSLCLRMLNNSSEGKVICLTGGKHPRKIDLMNMQSEKSFNSIDSYSDAKLIMMMVMYELSEQIKTQNVKINVCYPGQASTQMTRSVTKDMMPTNNPLLYLLFKLATKEDNNKSAEKVCKSTVFLATSNKNFRGKYFNINCKLVNWPRLVVNNKLRKEAFEKVKTIVENAEENNGTY